MTLFPSATAAAPNDPNAAPNLVLDPTTGQYVPAPTAKTATSSGPSIFGWHPSMPNLGGFKALGQLASGFAAIPEIAYSALPGGPKSMLPQVAGGLIAGLGGVASTIAAPIGIPGGWNVGENLIEPAVQSITNQPVKDFWQMSKDNGVLYGAINTVLNALPVTGPLAGIAGGAADVAEIAAKSAAEAAAIEGADATSVGASAAASAATKADIIANVGEPGMHIPHPFQGIGAQSVVGEGGMLDGITAAEGGDPLAYAEQVKAMADSLRTKATITHALAHPISGLFHGISEQAAASFAKLNPPETTVPTPEPTAADLANASAPAPNRGGVALTPEDINAAQSAARAMQAPERAAAEVMSGDTSVPRAPASEKLKTVAEFDAETKTATGISAEERAAQRAELQAAHDQAKAKTEVPGTGEGTKVGNLEERLAQPAAAWAQRMADRLPDSVNQIFAQMKGTIDKFHINTVRRSLESWVEVAQRQVQHSAAMDLSVEAGHILMDELKRIGAPIDQFKASQMLGEELNASMRGNTWAAEMLRSDGDPKLVEAMRLAARRGYAGLDPVWKKLSPEVQDLLKAKLHDAQEAWTTAMQQRMQTLLASRPGATGLEAAVLGLDQPPMSASQIKEYRKARLFLRMKAKLEARIADPSWTDPRIARDLEPLQRTLEKARAEGVALRDKEGVLQRNVEDLTTAPPRASRAEVVSRLAATLRDELAPGGSGGLTFDPGTGVVGFSEGASQVVGLAEQGVYDVAQLLAPGEAEKAILDAVMKPIGHTGEDLPAGIWGGNLKLGFWNDNGKVYVDISMDSHYDGTPLTPLEADLLGMAHEQLANFDARDFSSRPLSQAPSDQNLWMHHIADIMDRKSELSRYLAEQTHAEAGSQIMSEGDSVKAATTYATWDYALAKANPTEHQLGDIFARIKFDNMGKSYVDDVQLLKQTVMRMLPGTEASAIENMDVKSLHTALRWYYDSHDYIEGKYRFNADGTEKMITLLNGEQRSAAEVFYDLIAVTSVQASPTQNFGRALAGLANMDDFLQGRYTAMSSAQELMDKLEARGNDLTSITKPGWDYGVGPTEEEHISAPGEKGTKLANRFLTPEVRNITDATQMMNKPKYTVMDVLSGKLKLESATAGDLQHNAEWWGSTKTASADSMNRGQVVNELDRNNVHTPQSEAYRAWAQEKARLDTIFRSMKDESKADTGMGKLTEGQAFNQIPGAKEEFGSKAAFERARKAVHADEQHFLEDPEIADAHDQALMEHQGSSLLAKLRSFRSNLSAPETSLAVTLDSVMGRLWGFNTQQWDKVGFYAQYADKIRTIADELSKRWGREVAPHEVQAALWVHAKMEIGRQDWGRLLAHHDMAMEQIDAWERGVPVGPRNIDGHPVQPEDLLHEYKNEEVGYSKDAQAIRSDRQYYTDKKVYPELSPEEQASADYMNYDWQDYKALNNKVARGEITPADTEQWAEYEVLREKVGEGKTSQVTTTANRPDISVKGTTPYVPETRYEIAYDANKLRFQQERIDGYTEVTKQVKEALATKDFAKVRKLITDWVVSQHDSVMGQGGSSFGVTAEGQLIKGELGGVGSENATFTNTQRLGEAAHVPAPNDMTGSRFRPEALDEMLRKNQITQPQYDKLLAEWKAKLEPGTEPQLNQQGPHPEPGMTRVYRGSDFPEPQGMQGMWWTDHQPYGRGGYAHWQQTDLPSDAVERAKATVLDDRNRLDPAGTPVVGRDLILDPSNPTHANAMDRALAYMHDTIDHGDMADLHQSFESEVRGALLDHPTSDGHLVMRLFKNAALDTLLHEGAHLLRRILPSDMLKTLEEHYPGITAEDVAAGFGTNSVANPLRVAAEEKFVSDLMSWIRSKTHPIYEGDSTFPTSSKLVGEGSGIIGETLARSATMEQVYGQLAAVLEDNVLQQVGSPVGPQAFDINSFWTRLFFPEIDKPDILHDPIAAGVPPTRGVDLRQFNYETDQQFASRARRYGQARQQLKDTSLAADTAERRAVKAESAVKKMHILITTTPSDLEARAAQLGVKADNILSKLSQQMDMPDGSKVPMQWRPLWQGIQDMLAQAKADTTGRLAEIMADVPQTFQAVLKAAAEQGFDPTFLPDMTWEMANKHLFGHIQLGVDKVAVDSTRRVNTGLLHQAGIANQSLEQLGAGLVAATKELYANTLIDHIEQFYAQPLAAGAAIPKGWVPWSAEREYIMTGTRPSGELMPTHANMIVPEHVGTALDSMSKTYDHWTFHTLTRANSVWRTWQLTLSPRYYVHIFVANMIRAISAGAMPKDFIETIRKWKAGTLPDELIGLDMQSAYRTLTNEDLPKRSMPSIFRPGPETIGDTAHFGENISDADTKVAKVQAAITSTRQSLEKAHANLDKFSRSVVFERMLRTGATRDAALSASMETMGDYGALSPFERAIVRSIMPFYPYYKGLVKLLMRMPADHPYAAMALMQAGEIHKEYMQDLLHGPIPQSLDSTFNIFGLHQMTMFNPFINAVHAVEPLNLSSSLSPFVSILLRTAYNAPTKGTTTKAMGPTGKIQAMYDPLKGALQIGLAAPPVLAAQALAAGTPAQGLLGSSNAYGQSPGLQTAVAKYLGIPQPSNVASTQQKLYPTPQQVTDKKAAAIAKRAATRAAAGPTIKAPKGGWGSTKARRIATHLGRKTSRKAKRLF